MPLFEYRCEPCHQDFEVLVRNREQVTCPECGSKDVQKLLSAPSSPNMGAGLPISSGCNPTLPPCGPGCCKL